MSGKLLWNGLLVLMSFGQVWRYASYEVCPSPRELLFEKKTDSNCTGKIVFPPKCLWWFEQCSTYLIPIVMYIVFLVICHLLVGKVFVHIFLHVWYGDNLQVVTRVRVIPFVGIIHIDGLVQDCSISIANAMEILQSYIKPPIKVSLYQGQHIEAETKWPTFCRRHIQIHFQEWKLFYFDSNLIEICSQWSNSQ